MNSLQVDQTRLLRLLGRSTSFDDEVPQLLTTLTNEGSVLAER